MMVSGKDRSVIYRYAKLLVTRLPFMRYIAPALDRAAMRLTGGRQTLTGTLTGLPTATLTTEGARTGQRRTVVLVGMSVGSDIVLIASNWGQSRHPAWYHNLCANPRALLSLDGGPPRPHIAREAVGAERQQLWEMAVNVYPGYARYARSAAPRQIPVLVLSPA